MKIKKEKGSKFDDLSNTDGKEKEKLVSKNFQKYQFLRNYNQSTLTIYYFRVIAILCILKQCHLWIKFI